MPMYEYACEDCSHTFETLVFNGDKVECPECHSGDVSKERRHSYSCFQCGCRFNGYRVGKVRISL